MITGGSHESDDGPHRGPSAGASADSSLHAADDLLVGAFDLHAHGYPEISLSMPARTGNVEWGRLATDVGMRGFVIKSHVWPTTTAAQMLRSLYPDLAVIGSITLNPPAGGLSALSVELAAQAGARVVWMPTWSARSKSTGRSIFLERMSTWVQSLDIERVAGADGISIFGEDGRLSTEVHEIIEVSRRYDLTIASGHLAISESMALALACRKAGVRFVLTHPLNGSVAASIIDQVAFADVGAVIEHTFVTAMPMHHRLDPRAIAASIREVGAARCVMASDCIEGWNPPPPEMLRMFIATMLALGVTETDVFRMTHDNSLAAVGLQS